MSQPLLVLQHDDQGPPGLLSEWAQERGIPIQVHRADLEAELPRLEGWEAVACLGSYHSPLDGHVPMVRDEITYISEAIDRELPVLGLCYGGQLLASVLGGEVGPAPEPEIGWHRVGSAAPEIVAEGPWLQWHYHRFTLPPGAEELARSARALQAFRHGRHIGVQFHPEATIEVVRGWAREERERLDAMGIADGEAMLEQGRSYEPGAREGAFRLFDAFWARARETGAET
jgi:GMP synthase-like glutamine amidotransferase